MNDAGNAQQVPEKHLAGEQQDKNDHNWPQLLVPFALILGLALLLGLNTGTSQGQAAAGPFETLLKTLIGYLASGAEIAAALVIGSAILQGLVSFIRLLFGSSGRQINASEAIRLRLGRVLSLGLEFTVASDILRTAVAPTHRDIVNLAAVVLLRSLLNYFLEREIQQGEQARAQAAHMEQLATSPVRDHEKHF